MPPAHAGHMKAGQTCLSTSVCSSTCPLYVVLINSWIPDAHSHSCREAGRVWYQKPSLWSAGQPCSLRKPGPAYATHGEFKGPACSTHQLQKGLMLFMLMYYGRLVCGLRAAGWANNHLQCQQHNFLKLLFMSNCGLGQPHKLCIYHAPDAETKTCTKNSLEQLAVPHLTG